MIDFLLIVDPKEDLYFKVDCTRNNILCSNENNHGKTLFIKCLMQSFGLDDNLHKIKDKIDLNKLLVLVSINNEFYLRYESKFYIFENNNFIKIDKRIYCKKILNEFEFNDEIPFIQIKNNGLTNLYTNQIFTFFYFDSDKDGKNHKQLKNFMYLKKNIDEYFLILWKWPEDVINNRIQLSKNIGSSDIKKRCQNDNEVLVELRRLLDIISNESPDEKKIFINEDDINDVKKELDLKYKQKIELDSKIRECKTIVDFLQNFSDDLNHDIKYYIDREIDIYFQFDDMEISRTIKYSDFVSKFIAGKHLDIISTSKIIKSKENELKILNKKIDEVEHEIKLLKEKIKNKLNKININILGEHFFEMAFGNKIDKLKELEKIRTETIKKNRESEKKSKEQIKNIQKEYNEEFNKFKRINNWEGSTNSSMYNESFFRYIELNKISRFKNFPLVIDEIEKLGIDLSKCEKFLTTDNQKIISITSDKNEPIWKNMNFNIIDLSDTKYKGRLLNEKMDNLRCENEKLYVLYKNFIFTYK